MREALIKLLKVKTIITLSVVLAITVAFLLGRVPIEVYSPLAMSIITYYFRKEEKSTNEDETNVSDKE